MGAHDRSTVCGSTTLFGTVTHLNFGTRTVAIRFDDLGLRFFVVPPGQLAALADHIGGEVAVDGNAEWDVEHWTILRFDPTRVSLVHHQGIVEAFAQLREIAGDAWDGVDVAAYFAAERADD